MEMHLVSLCEQVAHLAGRRVMFHKRETIHTENSYKFTPKGRSPSPKRAVGASRRAGTSPAAFEFAVFLLRN